MKILAEYFNIIIPDSDRDKIKQEARVQAEKEVKKRGVSMTPEEEKHEIEVLAEKISNEKINDKLNGKIDGRINRKFAASFGGNFLWGAIKGGLKQALAELGVK